MRTGDEDNPAYLMAGQLKGKTIRKGFPAPITDPDLMIKKAITTCSNSSLPVPDRTYYELEAEGKYHGPACDCASCAAIAEKSRGVFR